jgi:hypothetical protein
VSSIIKFLIRVLCLLVASPILIPGLAVMAFFTTFQWAFGDGKSWGWWWDETVGTNDCYW